MEIPQKFKIYPAIFAYLPEEKKKKTNSKRYAFH